MDVLVKTISCQFAMTFGLLIYICECSTYCRINIGLFTLIDAAEDVAVVH
jgi:hypothetical protein